MSCIGGYNDYSHLDYKTEKPTGIDLPKVFVKNVAKYCASQLDLEEVNAVGYTSVKWNLDDCSAMFRAAPELYGADDWYDWCMIQIMEEDKPFPVSYIARISGFVKFQQSPHVYASITVSTTSISMDMLEKEFVLGFELGTEPWHSFLVEATNITNPLFVFENKGGHIDQYFCALPRRRWAGYFRKMIAKYN